MVVVVVASVGGGGLLVVVGSGYSIEVPGVQRRPFLDSSLDLIPAQASR